MTSTTDIHDLILPLSDAIANRWFDMIQDIPLEEQENEDLHKIHLLLIERGEDHDEVQELVDLTYDILIECAQLSLINRIADRHHDVARERALGEL